MTRDAPMRSKKMELFDKMHLGMDHVLEKLLLDAPPLPDSLKLQTETQSLVSTWVQITETFEKRKAMLQHRKEKEESKSKAKGREDAAMITQKKKSKTKEINSKKGTKQKIKSCSSSASPRTGTSSPSDRTEKESAKMKKKMKKKGKSIAQSYGQKQEADAASVRKEEPKSYHQSILKKLRKLPMCEDVVPETNKYKAIVKWMECDGGNNAATSTELIKLLEALQLQISEKIKPKSSQKRALESLDDTLWTGKRMKRKPSAGDGPQPPKPDANENKVSGEEQNEGTELNKGHSDSDEARLVPELGTSRLSRVESKETQKVEGKKTATQVTSREQLATVVAKIRANEAASGTETKYLSYEEKEQPVEAGASLKSAITLSDSDDEETKEEEVVIARNEEKAEGTQEQDSSTDDDHDHFDLNEEDVYVVEAILCVKEGRVLPAGGSQRQKESDLYLVKWEGYNELTWEPDENIPRRLIDMFRKREHAKRACQYQIKVAHERREVTNVTTQTREIIYLIQWINQDLPVWESRTTLPVKTQVWLDKVLGVSPAKKRRVTKAGK